MKRCPFCGEENLDQALACYYCGRDLTPAADDDVEPTQPRHVQRPSQGQTRPYPPGDRGANIPPQPPEATQPGTYGPPYGSPPASVPPYAQPTYPDPQSHTGYTQPYQPQQPHQQPQYPPGYYPQSPQQPPGYPPQPPAPPERSRLWGAVPIFLGMILLCICLVAAWAIADTANRGVARIGDQVATRAAGIFGGARSETDTPPPTPLPEEPSPWPTFTPETTAAAEPTSVYAEKLLTPECRAALDTLSGMTSQLSSEPLKLLEEAWRDGFNQARRDLTTYCGTLDAASPVPGHVQDAQNALNQANTEFDQANQLLQAAVDGRDPGKILEAAQHFAQAARNLSGALAALRDVVE